MAPRFNPEYTEMLRTPAPPTDGPRKHTIESLQKQIDFHVGEANRLRYAQNSHAAVSRLPPELLVEAFLYTVESGLQDDNTRFAVGTFGFLQVCRRWNEVAVGFPQLWGWWVAGGFKAWHVFSSRSKNVPIFLTWRPQLPASTRDILMDPTVPRRIRKLDFSGTSEQLEHFLGAFDSTPPSNASLIRLQIFPYDNREPREHLTRFLSTPFPKLSRLDLGSFLPDPSPSILTTSSLTSLKLFLPYGKKNRYTLSQFSRILKQHPNLRELELNHSAIPQPEPLGSPPVPFALPRLATLRLYGAEKAILGILDLIGMSSPLNDVVVRFGCSPDFHVPTLAGTVKKILVAYYECQGLDHPRKASNMSVSYDSEKRLLAFNSRSHPASPPNLRSNLKFQFNGIGAVDRNAMMRRVFPLFPLDDVRGFAIEGSALHGEGCAEIFRGVVFRGMKNLAHLRLDDLDLWSALDVLSSGDLDGPRTIPKLESLTLSHLDILFDCEEKLLDFLRGRYYTGGLKKLVLRWCRVHEVGLKTWLGGLVSCVKWENVAMVGQDYQGSDDELVPEVLEDRFDEDELAKYYQF